MKLGALVLGWLLVSVMLSQQGSGESKVKSLTAKDRLEIDQKTRLWARFCELPTSPVLRAVFPQMPRWAEVDITSTPLVEAAPGVHSETVLQGAYGDTKLTVLAGASSQLSLNFHSPSGDFGLKYRLEWCKSKASENGKTRQQGWSLSRVRGLGLAEAIASDDHKEIATSDFYALAGIKGGPLRIFRYGHGPNVTLLFSAIHGDEPNTAPLLENLVEYLDANPKVYADATVIVCPVVSPEGWRARTRPNGQGIDANRNFIFNFAPDRPQAHSPYFRGRKSLQTPEALALQHLVSSYRPDKIVAVHSPFDLINYDGPAADLAEAMHGANQQGIAPSIGYPTPGSFGTYAGLYLGIPTITLELSPSTPEWDRQKEALLRAIRWAPEAPLAPIPQTPPVR